MCTFLIFLFLFRHEFVGIRYLFIIVITVIIISVWFLLEIEFVLSIQTANVLGFCWLTGEKKK